MQSNTIDSGQGPNTPRAPRPAHFLLAAEALAEILDARRPADVILNELLRARRSGGRDRAAISSLVFGVLRNYFPLRGQLGEDAPVLELCVGLALRRGDPVPTLREVDGPALRTRLQDPRALAPSAQHNLPDWMWSRLEAQFPDEASALALALNEEASVDLRVNLLRGDAEQAIALLAAENIEARTLPAVATAIRLTRRTPLQRFSFFKDGWVEPQDAGSQRLALALDPKPGERIADFCAGAGGKTLAIGALMQNQGDLIAFDSSARRLSHLQPRLKRSGLSIVKPMTLRNVEIGDQSLLGSFDAVLVDAPCSGSGTMRRHPELRLQPDRLRDMQARQRSILDRAAPLLREGGRLMYATCSVFREENEDVVGGFLAETPGFEAGEALRLLPHRDGTDAYWAVTLRRGP